jgi:SpoVK/Ycf46/Vps4 family AAA+-type ATPase
MFISVVQVNSHSLFSRWFSESGKLVTKLFERIGEMVEDRRSLVVVLIDEIESLAMVRKSSSEPSDSVRAVNALLTQLDALKRHENVLVLTTSNLTDAVDSAFCSRADIKRYVGVPSARAVYEILRQSIFQLKAKGCVRFDACGDLDEKKFLRSVLSFRKMVLITTLSMSD